jgi:hypothetical protein
MIFVRNMGEACENRGCCQPFSSLLYWSGVLGVEEHKDKEEFSQAHPRLGERDDFNIVY